MIKKLFSVYSSNLLLGLLGIITVPILLKNIGVTGYGYYGIYLTILSYFALFELGILKHLTKLITQGIDVKEVIGSFYYFTITIITIFIPGIIFIITILFDVDFKIAILIGAITALEYIFYLPTKIYSAYATANKKFERLSLFNFLSGSIRYIFIIFGSIITNNIFIVIILLAVRRIFDIKLSRTIIGEDVRIFDIKNVNKINLLRVFNYYKESIYLSGTQALQINLNGMVTLIISKFFGLEGLGLYRSTVDILSKIWFFSNGLGLVVFPYFAGNSVGINKYKRYISISWVFYTFVFAIFIALFPLINMYLLNGILNDSEDFLLFIFTLITVLLVAQGNLSFEYLQAEGHYKYLLIITAITNLTFIILTFIAHNFIPYTYSVIICWMLSIIIQTISFESKSINRNKYLFFFSLLLIIVWIALGLYVLY